MATAAGIADGSGEPATEPVEDNIPEMKSAPNPLAGLSDAQRAAVLSQAREQLQIEAQIAADASAGEGTFLGVAQQGAAAKRATAAAHAAALAEAELGDSPKD